MELTWGYGQGVAANPADLLSRLGFLFHVIASAGGFIANWMNKVDAKSAVIANTNGQVDSSLWEKQDGSKEGGRYGGGI